MTLHKEGIATISFTLMTAVVLVLLSAHYVESDGLLYLLYAVIGVLSLLVINFFRYPKRHYEGASDGVVLSSADGVVVVIEEVMEEEYFHDKRIQVSVFMSVFNVHANWVPVKGTVKRSLHHNGHFMAAYLPKSSTENERSTVVIETPCGHEVLVRQVAGALARRIITYTRKDQKVELNHPLGFIKFGSRIDIYLPLESNIMVNIDQRVKGDITQIAQLPSKS